MMPLGDEPNDGWEEVEVVDVQNVVLDSEENALEGSLSGEKKEEEKNDGAAEELDGEALDKGPSTIIKPKRWKWTKDFVVNDGVTEDLARKIHNDPNVVCVLANLLSKVEPTGENDNGDEEESPPAKDANFLGFLPLDVSAFLDGDTSVSLTMSAEDYSLPDPPAGLLHWSFRVSTERPLLTREQRKMWNPLVINTRKVRCLPGVMLETNNPSMMKYMQPTRFSLLAKYCEPIFATIKFPPYPIDGFQRIIRTCALPQVNTPPVLQGSVSGEASNEESQSTAGQRTARSARSTLSRSSKTSSKKRTAVVNIDKSRRDADFH